VAIGRGRSRPCSAHKLGTTFLRTPSAWVAHSAIGAVALGLAVGMPLLWPQAPATAITTNYLVRLRNRMHERGFPHDDPMYLLVCSAHEALNHLRLHVTYLACDGAGRPSMPEVAESTGDSVPTLPSTSCCHRRECATDLMAPDVIAFSPSLRKVP
jgi:hypothetical protein